MSYWQVLLPELQWGHELLTFLCPWSMCVHHCFFEVLHALAARGCSRRAAAHWVRTQGLQLPTSLCSWSMYTVAFCQWLYVGLCCSERRFHLVRRGWILLAYINLVWECIETQGNQCRLLTVNLCSTGQAPAKMCPKQAHPTSPLQADVLLSADAALETWKKQVSGTAAEKLAEFVWKNTCHDVLAVFLSQYPYLFPILSTIRTYLFAARLHKWKDIQVRVKLEHFFLGRTETQCFLET